MRKITSKKSAYASAAGLGNVIDIAQGRAARAYRVEESISPSPSIIFFVPHRESVDGEKDINLNFLLAAPGLKDAFSSGLSENARAAASPLITVVGKCRNLKNGFFKYLETAKLLNISLQQIDNPLIQGFITWLNRTENGEPKYKKISKQHFFNELVLILSFLQASPRWSFKLRADLTIPKNVWSGEPDDRDHTKIIPSEQYRDIYQACYSEIRSVMSEVTSLREKMNAAMAHPIPPLEDAIGSPVSGYVYPSTGRKSKNPYYDLGLCLATLRKINPDVILSITELKKAIDKRILCVVRDVEPFGGIPKIYRCYYPYARDLVPFIIMMAIHLDYNLETLLRSRHTDFYVKKNELGRHEFHSTFDERDDSLKIKDDERNFSNEVEKNFIAKPRKARAKHRRQVQIRPFALEPDNPGQIWQFLMDWTAMIRPIAHQSMRDRMFLFVTQVKNRAIRGFGNTSTAGHDRVWRNAYECFFKDHDLPLVAFSQFRSTGLDITDTIFGGDIRAKQAAGNHADPQTTYRRYTTDAQLQRGDERLGQILQVRARWRKSRGIVDPRKKPDGSDLGAATPGWICADPFSGPYTADNKICMAYGLCPTCPHGSINLDTEGCAQAWNLIQAIDEAAAAIAPSAWATRWAPVKEKLLRYWIPKFSPEVVSNASTLRLQKLPPLEE